MERKLSRWLFVALLLWFLAMGVAVFISKMEPHRKAHAASSTLPIR